jgi:LysR family transcriptional regulator, nod-box dependent transcriptional activator
MRYHRLDLNLVVVLEALLSHGSVSRVADELGLTPSSISNALARLRVHFGDELFIMLDRHMSPTPFANSLRQPVQEFLQRARSVALACAAFDPATSTRNFRIALSDYAVHFLAGDLVRLLARQAPGMRLTILPLNAESLSRFYRGTIDLLVAPDAIVEASDASRLLFHDRFVPVAWAGNSAIGNSVAREMYFSANHVLADPAEVGQPGVLATFFLASPALRISVRVPNFLAVADLLAGTDRLSTLPAMLARALEASGKLRVLTPDFNLPEIRERLHWLPSLTGDLANAWVCDAITSVTRHLTPA